MTRVTDILGSQPVVTRLRAKHINLQSNCVHMSRLEGDSPQLRHASNEINQKMDEATALFERGDFEGAMKLYDVIIDTGNNKILNAWLFFLKAQCLQKIKRYDESVEYFDMALDVLHDIPEILRKEAYYIKPLWRLLKNRGRKKVD